MLPVQPEHSVRSDVTICHEADPGRSEPLFKNSRGKTKKTEDISEISLNFPNLFKSQIIQILAKKNGEESTSVQREKIIAHQNELPNLPWLPKPPKPACAPPKSFRRKPDNAPMVKPSQDKYRGQAIDLLRWHLLA